MDSVEKIVFIVEDPMGGFLPETSERARVIQKDCGRREVEQPCLFLPIWAEFMRTEERQ